MRKRSDEEVTIQTYPSLFYERDDPELMETRTSTDDEGGTLDVEEHAIGGGGVQLQPGADKPFHVERRG
jgi:hypothetical protein